MTKDDQETKQLREDLKQALVYKDTYEKLLEERDAAEDARDNALAEVKVLVERIEKNGESGRKALAALSEVKQKIKEMPDLALYAPAHSLADWILQIIERHEAD